MEEVKIRKLKVEDLPFMFSTWLNSYRSSRFARRIKKDIYYFWHHLLIEKVIDRPEANVLVACSVDDEDTILGYFVGEHVNGEAKIVHYIFVKDHFRRLGIAKMLLKASGTSERFYFTHWTFLVDPLVDRMADKISYDPYRI